LATALGIRACLASQRVAFATATEWVARLGDAKRQGNLEAELRRLSSIPLIVVDEVGYIPFDPEAANLMFSPARPVTSLQALPRYERQCRRYETPATASQPRSAANSAARERYHS
jgi:hypothetical protein